ncbi:hypothetical protein DTO212C5_929 [Paecilomyces variotii]|nr:hypothetical protein DTO212C5_929 [Paecilomyces variotii]
MSQYATELCTLLIEDNFGELFARIFSTLRRYDRLPLPRLRFYSGLSDRQLRYGLSAMIQHHLVFHYTSYDDGLTYYEANMQAAYYLIRSGKILEFIEDRLGKYASKVMSAILFLGHAQVGYLETLPELQGGDSAQPETNGVNGEHEEEPYENLAVEDGENGVHDENGQTENHTNDVNGDRAAEEGAGRLHPTLKALAAHGYIIRVREAQFQSPADNLLYAERAMKARSDIKMLKGKKLEEAVAEGAVEMVKERTDGDLSRGLMFNGIPRGAKRRHANGTADGPNKKQKVDDSAGYEDDDEENDWSDDEGGFEDTAPMESGLIVRVNYEKLDVAFRNRRLVELSEQGTSAATAQVYETLLRRIEYQTPRCRDEPEIPYEGEEGEQYSVAIPLHALVQEIDPDLDLASSIGPADPSQTASRRGKRPLDEEDGGNAAGNEAPGGRSRAYEVDQHLALLAQPPYNFSSRRTTTGIITWTVEWRHLARKLRHLELERMIEARYGDVALRVARVLHSKGKLDEKRLQEISLLPPKDLRQVLASMQAGGFVDLQEVPRDAQRQPSKTIYLWFYDPDRVRRNIVQDIYKAMSRCLQRITVERDRLKEFLEKCERSDVKGNEERYLSEAELQTLQQWRDKEALLLGEVARLDDMVAVLRDY